MPDVVTLAISARPSTLRTIKRAVRLYDSIARGELKIYAAGPAYKFHEPDLAIMRDTADELRALALDLEFKLKHAGVTT